MELFGTPFVAIDGTPADNGQVVRDGAKIELGRVGGPAFNLGIAEDTRADNYLRTAGQAEAASPRAIARRRRARWRVSRARSPAVAVVVALGGGAFAAYNYISTSRTTARLETAQKEFSDALAREANLRIGADVRAHSRARSITWNCRTRTSACGAPEPRGPVGAKSARHQCACRNPARRVCVRASA